MLVCPRCKNPARQAPSVCTQCGYDISAEAPAAPQTGKPTVVRGVLWLVLFALVVFLFAAVSMFIAGVNQLVK
jgi:hypothetical protein